MKKLIIAFTTTIALFFNLNSLSAQHTLTVTINGLKNNTGQILLELCNDKGEKISGHIRNILNKQCVIIIKDLKPGKYSFKFFHDENMNQKLDTKFPGIPAEGFGFSNNARGKFGPPDFEKTIISINCDISQTCTLIYY